MTIAGSDSGGGAGIEADLKTFSALGVFGTCVITAITAQNTTGVQEIFPVPPDMVRAQIRAVLKDIPVKAAKTGMLYSRGIMEVVAEAVENYGLELVVDPVFRAGTGSSLIVEEDKTALVELLLPRAKVLTPNLFEAEAITGLKIDDLEDMKAAARRIADLGAEAVVIKGGHLGASDQKLFDVFYHRGSFRVFEKERVDIKPHGGGCVFSAAITSFLARGESFERAVEEAERFIEISFRGATRVGSGRVPVNPLASLYKKSEAIEVLTHVEAAAKKVEENASFLPYIAEVGTQIAMALPFPTGHMDVAAIEGRIVKIRGRPKAVGPARLGASKHIANIILAAVRHDPEIRAAMNLHYDPRLVEAFRKIGCEVAEFDRRREPVEVKQVEGESLSWGTEEAIRSVGRVPDIIYDKGEVGKEPMIRILGRDAVEVVEKALKAIKALA
jgi:hydroxymethylpyrimidine/phosphomethylpyrimidine kinase